LGRTQEQKGETKRCRTKRDSVFFSGKNLPEGKEEPPHARSGGNQEGGAFCPWEKKSIRNSWDGDPFKGKGAVSEKPLSEEGLDQIRKKSFLFLKRI